MHRKLQKIETYGVYITCIMMALTALMMLAVAIISFDHFYHVPSIAYAAVGVYFLIQANPRPYLKELRSQDPTKRYTGYDPAEYLDNYDRSITKAIREHMKNENL